MTTTTARLTRRGALGALGALGVLGLTACGGSGSVTTGGEGRGTTEPAEKGTGGSDDGGATPAPSEDETSDAAEGASAGAGPSAELPVGAELRDEALGDTITIVSVLRDVATERQARAVERGGEVIYVQVAATPGTQYGGSITPSDFHINPGQPDEDNTTLTLEPEITAAGLTAFDSAPRRDGGNPSGWIALVAEKRKDTYTAAYIRPEAKVLGKDTVIPEFRGEFTIPAA
ncbi:hypothetical protein ACT3TZ_06140 [Brachybacterium sp. AOP25-B2-12]|uniref:hypothetical protein n=1 Tax=Brachybacterium sp. AOP25-B2-12 TaxID=3457710 RepID=UPI004034663B